VSSLGLKYVVFVLLELSVNCLVKVVLRLVNFPCYFLAAVAVAGAVDGSWQLLSRHQLFRQTNTFLFGKLMLVGDICHLGQANKQHPTPGRPLLGPPKQTPGVAPLGAASPWPG